jgi:hypothetical protein
VFGVFHDGDDGVNGPVQIQDVQQVGEVVRDEIAESDRDGNRGQEDQQGNHCQESRVGKRGCTGQPVKVQEGFPCNNRDFYGCDGTRGYRVKHPFPGKIREPIWHHCSQI